MLRAFGIIFGIVLAAIGGVIAFRAFFEEQSSAVMLSSEGVRHLPNTYNVLEGIVLLILGAALAFMAAIRRRKR